MNLPVQTFSGLISQMAASVQGSASQLVDFSIGSVIRAMMEACAAVAVWLQWLILLVLSSTRAATSQGPDLDSWMADFSFTRLPGVAASGNVTMARYTAGITATVPVGAMVLTFDGVNTYSVIAEPSNPAWNGSNGFTLPAPAISIDVPVVAVVVGSGGNVLANSIGLVGTTIVGVDSVSNALPFTDGMDQETDIAFRGRFLAYINNRSLATVGAIESAITSLQQGIRFTVIENQNLLGLFKPGSFCVVADDGAGESPPALLESVQTAVDAVRPIGSTYSVSAPSQVYVSVAVVLETSNPVTHIAVATEIQVGIVSWITGLPMGGTLAISKLDAIAHGADPSVTSVTSTLINGAAADVTAPETAVLSAISVTVN